MKKTYVRPGKTCRVTFALPEEAVAERASLCGEFNDWDAERHPLTRRKDGSWTVTVSLPSGRGYRFRYLVDGSRWENDWDADRYAPNTFGTEDSIVEV